MAFKLRLQIFFLILTVLPLLVGGWMIQRTVIESERSSIDHRLASGVGNLGAQYGSILGQATTALQQVPKSQELQKAIVEDGGVATRKADVTRVVKQASADGVQITVQQGKTLLTPAADDGSQRVGERVVGTKPPTTVTVYVTTSTLISRLQQADPKVLLGLATGNQLQL